MKKKLILLISSFAVLGVIGLQNNQTSDKFTYNTLLKSNEVIGKKFKATKEEFNGEFVEGDSTFISSCVAQVNQTNDSIRFVSALKGTLKNNFISVDGYARFHVKYNKVGGETVDEFLKVENYYLSMNANNTWYYANDLSTYKDSALSMNDFLAIKGFENQDYNLFVSLDIQNIDASNKETLIEVQPYYVNKDGVRSYSKYTKLASAVGYETKFIIVNDNKTPLTKTEDGYKVENLSLTAGDKVSIVDSYGIKENDYLLETLTDGYYVAPRTGSYDFILTNDQIKVNKPLSGSIVTFDNYDETNIPVVSDETILLLPKAKVTDPENIDQTENVKVEIQDLTDTNAIINNGNFMSNKVGNHELKYTFIDKRTNEVIAEKTINVKVYMKIVKDASDINTMELTDEANNPVIKVNNKGVFGLSFNFEASQNYYAEFELAKFDSLINNQVVGISNNLTATGTPTEGLYWEGFKTNNNGWEIATSKYVTSWDINRMWAPSDLANKRKNSPELDLKNKATKMAVARIGDTFYYFYNDKLFSVNEYPELKGISTYPGIITWAGDQDKVIPTSFSKFNFIKNSEDVKNKVEGLVETYFDYYVCWDDSRGNDLATFNKDGFTWKENATTNNNQNGSMVSPLINLWNNFEVNFDLSVNKLGDNDGWGKFVMDIRTYQDRKTVAAINSTIGGDRNFYEGEMFATEVGSQTSTKFIDDWKSAFGGSVSRDTILHFNVKLTKITDNTETYQFTISDKNDATKTYTFTETVTYNGDCKYLVGGPKYLIFKSQKLAGTVSNFQYK